MHETSKHLKLMYLDKRAFIKPDEFIPERWSTRPELIPRKEASIPFSYGSYNCAGKSLALTGLRMILAMIVKRFSITFPVDKTAERWRFINEQADCFIAHLQPLSVLLKERHDCVEIQESSPCIESQ